MGAFIGVGWGLKDLVLRIALMALRSLSLRGDVDSVCTLARVCAGFCVQCDIRDGWNDEGQSDHY